MLTEPPMLIHIFIIGYLYCVCSASFANPGKENIPPGKEHLYQTTRARRSRQVSKIHISGDENVAPQPSPLPTPPQSPPAVQKRECSSPVKRERTVSPVKRECRSPVKNVHINIEDPAALCTMELRSSPLKKRLDLTPPPRTPGLSRDLMNVGSLSCSRRVLSYHQRRGSQFPGYEQYQEVKSAFCQQDSIPEDCPTSGAAAGGAQLPGREAEAGRLRALIEQCMGEQKSASLYISGPPGTGKSASVTALVNKYIKVRYMCFPHSFVA